MDSDIPTDYSDTLKLYLQEEGLAALSRIRAKILGTAAATAVGSAIWATATDRGAVRLVPAVTANAAVAMTAFAVCQEGVRAARQGEDDGWNSFCAGGLAGAALTRLSYGRGFHLLGAVVWAPLCGTLHWAAHKLQPAARLHAFLVAVDLADAPAPHHHHPQQQQQGAAALQGTQQQVKAAPVPIRFEDMPWQDKVRAVAAVKERELQELHDQLRAEEQAAREASLRQRRQQQQQQDQQEEGAQRRRWWLW